MENTNLTKEESGFLEAFAKQTEEAEMQQVEELCMGCNNPYQFAKTHSNYIKDWEKTKKILEDNLSRGILPPNTSENLAREVVKISDKIIQKKLETVRLFFEMKFNESIYNYLGPDGKTKFLGIF